MALLCTAAVAGTVGCLSGFQCLGCCQALLSGVGGLEDRRTLHGTPLARPLGTSAVLTGALAGSAGGGDGDREGERAGTASGVDTASVPPTEVLARNARVREEVRAAEEGHDGEEDD
jgi:hypothetical protein